MFICENDDKNTVNKCNINYQIFLNKGDWNIGKRNGKGTCKYANEDFYIENWIKDLQHGIGLFTFGNGDKFEVNKCN